MPCVIAHLSNGVASHIPRKWARKKIWHVIKLSRQRSEKWSPAISVVITSSINISSQLVSGDGCVMLLPGNHWQVLVSMLLKNTGAWRTAWSQSTIAGVARFPLYLAAFFSVCFIKSGIEGCSFVLQSVSGSKYLLRCLSIRTSACLPGLGRPFIDYF